MPGTAFNHQAALDDLHTLGRSLDAQVTHRTTAPTTTELDATLAAMKQLHFHITAHLHCPQHTATA
jgi:HAMP domain-containing protein